MDIKDYALNKKEYITELRRYFHKHPEESLKEYETAKKIEEELDKLNIPHKRIGETGVLGIIKGKTEGGKVIAVRADIDALKIPDLKENIEYKSLNDGYQHSCGHDGHTSSLLGTAKALKEQEDSLNGEVRLIFQQAEEYGQGAKIFIDEGVLEGVDEIIGAHVAPDLPVGKIAVTTGATFASCDYFKIVVKGLGSHVSTPHLGVDALYIASQIVVNLQAIVSRQTDPIDTVVVGVGVINGGTTYNTVAGEVVLEGSTRAFTMESRDKTNASVERIARNIAETYGGSIEIEFNDSNPPLINDARVSKDMEVVVSKIIGKENVVTDFPKKLAADDFSEFLLKVPGTYIQVGTRNNHNEYTASPLHNERFDIDEDALVLLTNVEVDYVLSKLENK